jgi:RNA-directed DNA polymerase
MKTPEEQPPPSVPATGKQGGKARAIQAWAEPSVWTEPMLMALERGIKGGKWFSLIDKVWNPRNLESSWQKVRRNGGAAGPDGCSVTRFERDAAARLEKLSPQLREGTYTARPVRRTWIEKPGSAEKRPLGIPDVSDRIVQGALRHVLEPIFERTFSEYAYGFRPGRGAKDALRRVDGLLKEGRTWVVDADIKGYFDAIPHDRLMDCLRQHVSDGRVLDLVEKYLKAGVMDSLHGWSPGERGTPQGAVISPLLANIYLNELDHLMTARGYAITRYADDFVILTNSQEEAEEALKLLRTWTASRELTLHPEKTRLTDASVKGQGFEFLGYRFEAGSKWPRRKSLQKLRDTIRARTPRLNGRSLEAIITGVNSVLRGWFGYFKHSNARTMPAIDGFVRRRLRSILRRREGKRATMKNGSDYQYWPNKFFDAHGLFCLTAARQRHCQSRNRVNC